MTLWLTKRDLQTIKTIHDKYPEVEEVLIYGSRAKGNDRKGSDIDLVIMNENVSQETISRVKFDFEESTLAYFVDVAHYPTIKDPGLKEHIARVGKTLFRKGKGIEASP